MGNDDSNSPCSGGCGASSKWAEATTAVKSVVQATSGSLNWGIAYFADDSACDTSQSLAVTVGADNGTAITTSINATTLGGNAPICGAVIALAGYMTTLSVLSPKFLLLVTDGLDSCPNCTAGASQAVAQAKSEGVRTFVLGVGNLTGTVNSFDQMATAGGEARTGGPVNYYRPIDAAALTSALMNIPGCNGP
jgi:hypothetical protein